MNRTVIVLGLMLSTVSAKAYAQAQAPAAPTVPWANKFFQKENTPAIISHDFGTVPAGTLLQHTFTITNIYDVPMQVVYVRKSCSCLEAFPPLGTIPPNETAEFKVTMDANKFKGPNAQTFNVTFGPNFVSTATIQVKANARADVQLAPGQVNFGVVAQGAKASQTVTVRYTGRQRDWKITGVAPSAGPFDVTIEEPGNKWFNSEFRVTVALKPNAPSGQVSGTVQLQTNDSTAPLVPISVSAVVQAPLTVAPAKAKFARVTVGQTATQRIMIRAAKPFKVEPYADDATGISADVGLNAAAPVQIVTVKFTPKTAGAIRAELKLRTDLDGAVVTIPIEAEAVNP